MAMPGDVVLGRDGGVIFIPPQLAEQVVKTSEATHLRDMFGHQRLAGVVLNNVNLQSHDYYYYQNYYGQKYYEKEA